MKTFEFSLAFLIGAYTRGYKIKASDKDDALRKITECIDKDGQFDFQKFAAEGGTTGGWEIDSGTDHNYEMTDPATITEIDDEDEEDEDDAEDSE
jgi:hypothetical protein